MEWNIFSEEDSDLISDLCSGDAANDELVDENASPLAKPLSARRTIEILIEQKQLNKELSDIF